MPHHFYEAVSLHESQNQPSNNRETMLNNGIAGDHAHEVRG